MNEALLLTKKTVEFRNSYPELIAQWEMQIGHGNCPPDLHFCLTLVDDFPYLNAYLRSIDYLFGFTINAYIIHSNWQRDFIESGYSGNSALELANHEIHLTYNALNESEAIVKDPKAKIYRDILA